MADLNKSYRIRTNVGDSDKENVGVVNVHLDQTYDMLEILSLKLDQKNEYKYYESDYGVIVGRVLANSGFGIPNARLSIFIPVEETDSIAQRINYKYTSVHDDNVEGVRYNLLPDRVDSACHQDVGTFPNKRYVLDNDDVIETYEKYWKYTTTTNQAGDYMLFGVPTGSQQLHVDVDLSDCGILSQKPTDMVYKGYGLRMFDSPTKFKKSKDLNSLVQIYSQDKGVYVYPYWGETTNNGDNLAITRCDINLEYKFEPTCVFIGSVITDKGNNAIGKNCAGTDKVGKMSDMTAGEGTIEMIRKTLDNKVEIHQIQGDRLIDGDGVWCYQIPMNLDYVKTDEFGNLVPTDDPGKGIPTRARVRFRISLDEQPDDGSARKRCRYLVPNNPRLDDEGFRETLEADYEFGTATREESYVDLFWNKVYTVKNYIPRFQKNGKVTNRKHTGIKMVNHYGDNNPMPYNNLSIKLSFTHRLICVLVKVIIYMIVFINFLLCTISFPFCLLVNLLKGVDKALCFRINLGIVKFTSPTCILSKILIRPMISIFEKLILPCVKLSSEFCDDGINKYTYYPGCIDLGIPCAKAKVEKDHRESQKNSPKEEWTLPEFEPSFGDIDGSESHLFTCVENSLAQDNEATSFNFQNDWINGVLYMPLWYRKITPKKSFLFGLFKRRAKDQWCDANKSSNGARLYHPCAVPNVENGHSYNNFKNGDIVKPRYMINGGCGEKCHTTVSQEKLDNGVILTRQTMTGSTVYYYKAVEWDVNNIVSHTVAGYDKNGNKSSYYSEYDDRPSKGEIKLLFATDIVLLGSLNACDIHGVPQFFKKLDSTTYNLPTDILFTDMVWSNSVDKDGNVIVDDTGDPMYQATQNTEMTGCDWGNLNPSDECGKMGKDDDGGLFYSIGCSSIDLKPKSCINLKRICEYGVSLDETKYVPNLSKLQGSDSDQSYDLLIPDGFVSYDELYNLDERSMFATMNGNKLRTVLNKTNGLKEYDFRYLYPESFDGSLLATMTSDLGRCGSYTYGKNYNLEAFSEDYYRFRMGDKPYFYDIEGRFPRYENSFFFYFGLKSGKTAIEKFNSQFFAECEDTEETFNKIGIKFEPNTWCGELNDNYDGFVAIDLTGIATPYDIIINSNTNASFGLEINNVNDEKVCFVSEDNSGIEKLNSYTPIKDVSDNYVTLPNGDYTITITDADGNISDTSFIMNDKYLSFELGKVNFEMAENILRDKLGDDEDFYNNASLIDSNISSTWSTSSRKLDTNEVGGILYIENITDNDVILGKGDVFITVKPLATLEGFTKFAFSNENDADNIVSKWEGNTYIVHLPAGDISYEVTVTRLCDVTGTTTKIASSNSVTQTILVKNPIPYELYINDVDYNLISHWKTGNKNNYKSQQYNTIKNWFQFSDTGNYHWKDSRNYVKLCDELKDNLNNLSNVILSINSTQNINGIESAITNIESKLITNSLTDTKLSEVLTILNNLFNSFSSYNENAEYENAKSIVMDAYNEIISFIEETKTNVKNTFWMECPDAEKEIQLIVKTDKFPISYKTYYQDETYNTDINRNILSTNDVTQHEDMRISGITMPTITYEGSELYKTDGNVVGGGTLRYVKDENNTSHKPIYVAVMNGQNATIPSTVGNNGDNINDISSKLNEYFGLHIIDKIFSVKYTVWSYIHSLPYFRTGETSKDGKYVEGEGYFAGKIFNGNPTVDSDKKTNFSEQTLDGKTFGMWTENGEDEMPTKRYVIDFNGMANGTKYNTISYSPYVGTEKHYISVRDKELNLSISNNLLCNVSDTIYGNMNITMDENLSFATEKTEQNKLYVKTSGTDVIKYYIVSHESRPYPINKYNNATNTIVGIGNSDIFYPFVDIDSFKDDSVKSSYMANEDDETPTVSNGWGTDGIFTDIEPDKAYYVIAVTENNCRCISPVYDFKTIKVELRLVTEITVSKASGNGSGTGSGSGSGTSSSIIPSTEEGGEDTSVSGSVDVDVDVDVEVDVEVETRTYRYMLGVEIVNQNDVFYIKTEPFSYKIRTYCNAVSSNTIDDTKTIEDNSNRINYDINASTYNTILNDCFSPLTGNKNKLINKTQVYITDTTGLRHLCKIVDVKKEEPIIIYKEDNEEESGE